MTEHIVEAFTMIPARRLYVIHDAPSREMAVRMAVRQAKAETDAGVNTAMFEIAEHAAVYGLTVDGAAIVPTFEAVYIDALCAALEEFMNEAPSDSLAALKARELLAHR